jgi:TPP-dependent pyruvate/acetoin dehydrogenase alpha subunit
VGYLDPLSAQTAAPTLADKAIGGIPVSVDGTDVLAVYEATATRYCARAGDARRSSRR